MTAFVCSAVFKVICFNFLSCAKRENYWLFDLRLRNPDLIPIRLIFYKKFSWSNRVRLIFARFLL